MSREAAKKIVDLMIKHRAEQNAVLAEIQSICPDGEFQKYKRMIGQSMGCMLVDVINPIVELYPDVSHRSWNKPVPSRLTHMPVKRPSFTGVSFFSFIRLSGCTGALLSGRLLPAMFKRPFEFW